MFGFWLCGFSVELFDKCADSFEAFVLGGVHGAKQEGFYIANVCARSRHEIQSV